MNRFSRTVLTGVALYFLAGRLPFVNGLLGWLALAWTGASYARGPRATWTGAAVAGALAGTLGALANVFWTVTVAGLAPASAASGVYAVGVGLMHVLVAPLVGACCGVAGAVLATGRRRPWGRSRWWWGRRRWWR